MKFTWLNKQGVETDEGIVVQFTGRFTAEYRDDKKLIKLDIESGIMGSKSCIHFSRSDFKKWSNGRGDLTLLEQEKAINIFKNALIFQGLVPLDEK